MSEQKPNECGAGVQSDLGALPLFLKKNPMKRSFAFPPENVKDAHSIAAYGEETRPLYVIGLGNYWKIGVAQNLLARFRALRSETQEKNLVLGGYINVRSTAHKLTERYAHAILNDRQVHGEWFECDMDSAINAIKEAQAYSERLLRDFYYFTPFRRAVETEFPEKRTYSDISKYLTPVGRR